MKYCGILGHPLKKPRSIKIWKSFFKKNKIKCDMKAFNIKPKNFKLFFKKIKKDENFLATAITMPYKKKSKFYTNKLDIFAKYSDSINLIIKKNNKLNGFNTDIKGAVKSLGKLLQLYKNITIIGYGGTGSAILNFLVNKYNKNYLLISNKKNHPSFIKKKCLIKNEMKKEDLNKKQLVINCTPLGSDLLKSYKKKTPIKESQLPHLDKESFIFDIIYKPKKTKLGYLCKKYSIQYKNGIEMNTFQAEIAIELLIKNLLFFKDCTR